MLCASCKHPLLPSDAAVSITERTLSLHEFLRSMAVAPNPARYSSEIATVTPLLGQYDDEIRRVEDTLRGLIENRNKVQEYIDGCTAAVAPVRRLPAELLTKIFQAVASPQPSHSSENEWCNLIKRDLLRAARVCSYWHVIAMGTPILWSEIAVNTRYWPRPRSYFRVLRICLERTRGAPLVIALQVFLPSRGFLDLLSEHCDHCQSLSLSINPQDLKLFGGLKGNLDMLETLSFDFHYHSGDTRLDDLDIFEKAPRLKHFRFQSDHRLIQLPKLPWSQLHTLVCRDTTDEFGHLRAIERLSRGATFRLLGLSGDRYYTLPLNILPVTSLISTFTVEVANYYWTLSRAIRCGRMLAAVLDSLTLPHLDAFRIQRADSTPLSYHTYNENHAFEHLSERSSFRDTLRWLDLSGVDISDEDLIRAITPLASLEILEVSDWSSFNQNGEERERVIVLSDKLLQRLNRPPEDSGSGSMIPRLKRFVCTSLFMFSPQLYYHFVASRTALIDAPFENTLHTVRGVRAELVDSVIQTLQPLVAARTLKLSHPAPGKEGEEDSPDR